MSGLSFKIYETKLRLLKSQGFKCQVCQCPINEYNCQLAHRIIKSKSNIEKYGEKIIHHDFNLVAVCELTCNSKVNIENKPEEKKKLLLRIKKELNK